MQKPNFEILEWSVAGKKLLDHAKHEISNAPSEKIRGLSNRIPSEIIDTDDEKIKIVFAGQYGAGKSTIMKALTNRDDIAIGSGIVTQKVHDYEWNGVKVIDTPGIHTELRPDHDEISYQAISDADLLVFVVTNELFDSHIAQHFRKLAIEKDKAHEMLLVINKMGRCARGNSPEMQDTIREDLRNVLVPFSPEELRTCFIDAEYGIKSKLESDEGIANIFWRKSGMDPFIHELNGFIRDKGLSGRYTTALYNLEQVLQEAIAAESTGDEDVDALEELLLQRRRALIETQDRIPRAVEGEIQRIGTKIRHEGRKVADLIHGSSSRDDVDSQLQESQNLVQVYSEKLGQSIERVIGGQMEELEQRISSIANSELAKELLPRLEIRIKKAKISSETVSNLKTAGDISQKLGKFLIQRSFSLKEGFNGLFNLRHYSGTATHEAVKAIGKFFGHKFKPWEAVKWTRGVANVGRGLAVVGTLLTFVLQVKEDADAAQLESDLRESRATIRSGFNEAAHQIEMHYDQATGAYVASTLASEVESVDNQLEELRNMQQTRGELFSTLVGLLEETRALIRKLHTNS